MTTNNDNAFKMGAGLHLEGRAVTQNILRENRCSKPDTSIAEATGFDPFSKLEKMRQMSMNLEDQCLESTAEKLGRLISNRQIVLYQGNTHDMFRQGVHISNCGKSRKRKTSYSWRKYDSASDENDL